MTFTKRSGGECTLMPACVLSRGQGGVCTCIQMSNDSPRSGGGNENCGPNATDMFLPLHSPVVLLKGKEKIINFS